MILNPCNSSAATIARLKELELRYRSCLKHTAFSFRVANQIDHLANKDRLRSQIPVVLQRVLGDQQFVLINDFTLPDVTSRYVDCLAITSDLEFLFFSVISEANHIVLDSSDLIYGLDSNQPSAIFECFCTQKLMVNQIKNLIADRALHIPGFRFHAAMPTFRNVVIVPEGTEISLHPGSKETIANAIVRFPDLACKLDEWLFEMSFPHSILSIFNRVSTKSLNSIGQQLLQFSAGLEHHTSPRRDVKFEAVYAK